MRVSDRVRVTAVWSSFFGFRGYVVAVKPHLMIRIDGDTYPIRMGEREVTVEAPLSTPMTGAE